MTPMIVCDERRALFLSIELIKSLISLAEPVVIRSLGGPWNAAAEDLQLLCDQAAGFLNAIGHGDDGWPTSIGEKGVEQ